MDFKKPVKSYRLPKSPGEFQVGKGSKQEKVSPKLIDNIAVAEDTFRTA